MSIFNSIDEVLGKIIDTDRVELETYIDEDGRTGLTLTCLKCGRQRKILWKRFNYRGATLCECSDKKKESYKDYIGTVYQGYTIKNIDYDIDPKQIELECNSCGSITYQGAKNVITRIRKKMPIAECGKCRDIKAKEQRAKYIINKQNTKHQEHNDKYGEYIGQIFGTDEVLEVSTESIRGNIALKVKCIKCNRTRLVEANRVIGKYVGKYRKDRITRCICDRSGEAIYSKYIGKTCYTDTIIDFNSIQKDDSVGFDKVFTLKCNLCGEVRKISAVYCVKSAADKYVNGETRPKNLGYKLCNCIPGTRSQDTLSRYNRFIDKKIGDTFLTLKQPYINNKSGTPVWGIFQCDCGKMCKKPFHAVQLGHISSCGCIKSTSLGERIVQEVLQELDLNFVAQASPDDLINDDGYRLRFDFAIKFKDGSFGVIEYDGEQHYDVTQCDFKYHLVDFEEFDRIQRNDRIKDDYCKRNNYKLLRLRDKYYRNKKEAIKNEIKAFFSI